MKNALAHRRTNISIGSLSWAMGGWGRYIFQSVKYKHIVINGSSRTILCKGCEFVISR